MENLGSITLDMVRSPQPAHVHRFARGICIDLCACMYITFVSYRIVHYPSVCVAKLLSGLVDQNRSSSATWACSSVSCELEPSAVFIIVITSCWHETRTCLNICFEFSRDARMIYSYSVQLVALGWKALGRLPFLLPISQPLRPMSKITLELSEREARGVLRVFEEARDLPLSVGAMRLALSQHFEATPHRQVVDPEVNSSLDRHGQTPNEALHVRGE